MVSWYLIIVNFLVGIGMTLVGFKLHKPKFKSEEAETNFYKNYSLLFQIGGPAMIAWGLFDLLAK